MGMDLDMGYGTCAHHDHDATTGQLERLNTGGNLETGTATSKR